MAHGSYLRVVDLVSEGVRNTLVAAVGDPDAVAAVMFHSRPNVPSINTVRCPFAAVGWLFMENRLGTEWCYRRLVEIEHAMHLGIG